MVLVVLATAVSNIATVPRMSNHTDYVDMFAYSLSITLMSLLQIARYIECYYYGRGERKNIKISVRNELTIQILPLALYVAATIVAGRAYFGNDYVNDERRELAGGSTEAFDCDDSNKMHIPIILVLIGYIISELEVIVAVVFCMEKNGEHKKM